MIRICGLLSWFVPDRIVCCAERSAQVHESMGYAASKLEVIPNGTDLHLFQPDPEAGRCLRAQLGLSARAPVLGMVARFNPQKDHQTLFEALAHLRDLGLQPHCLLAGAGMESGNQKLLSWLENLGLMPQVHLLGSRSDIAALMNAIDIHVLSSAVEGFPNVLAEAMASGVPCIATDVGDSGLILGPTGWLVPPRAPRALAAALAEALQETKQQFQKRRHASRQRIAERFSISRMVDRYIELYGELT